MSQSIFAAALQKCFDESERAGFISRKGWAEFSSTTDAIVDQWLNDQCLPSPCELRAIIGCLEFSNLPQDAVTAFRSLFDQELRHISPIAEKEPIIGRCTSLGAVLLRHPPPRKLRLIGNMTLGSYFESPWGDYFTD